MHPIGTILKTAALQNRANNVIRCQREKERACAAGAIHHLSIRGMGEAWSGATSPFKGLSLSRSSKNKPKVTRTAIALLSALQDRE